jgi:hypothetical protein
MTPESKAYMDAVFSIRSKIQQLYQDLDQLAQMEKLRAEQLRDPVAMARCYGHLRQAAELIEETRQEGAGKTLEALRWKGVPELFAKVGVPHIPVPELGRRIETKSFISARMQDEKACIEWLKSYEEIVGEEGEEEATFPYAHLPKETVHFKALDSVASKLAKQNKALPDVLTGDDGKPIMRTVKEQVLDAHDCPVVDEWGDPVFEEREIPLALFKTTEGRAASWRKS